ncbi:phosphatidylinositol 4-phosphate 5-kinase-like protein 1 isoform X4 [Silurus meridionalis]|uniref:phosphatidylinositol 4-phosphate 5-kinase-like protein 1 isoform X4 n=1 Tax=Silurus meridionalis TaxID=175797 RepID=UPI001EEBF8E5|nr:phosphatidylinositol 4-phosphate 5-kinase-like protein 1 isoform X4 [Silurus meridionalis]
MQPTEQQMEMAGPSSSGNTRPVKMKSWGGLRQRWKLLGVFEIDQQHEFYPLTCMMKEGLAAAVQNTIDNPIPNELCDDDYQLEVMQIHKGFKMETFAGPVFASLRRSLGMTEKEYQHSLSSEGCYLQFISNSKSKADFFLTNDKRFFLKTQSRREIRFLLSHLKHYMDHLEMYPHSLLVKFLGVHSIKICNRRKYFIVMQSVFYPDERICARYDIKGCEVSRWTDPAPEGSQVIVVLKDLNFEGRFITLGDALCAVVYCKNKLDQQRPWLLRQVQIDTSFLQTLNVLDYSLLLAHQPLHKDERHPSLSFASLIMRTKKSLTLLSTRPVKGRSLNTSSRAAVPGVVPEDDSSIQTPELDPGTSQYQIAKASQAEFGEQNDEASTVESKSAELLEFQAQNRRLLPNFKNPIHVIDGPEQRYFIGIIDIFTVYGFKKRLEHLWKRLRHPGQSFSTVSPPAYCVRLCQWVQDHTN